jgi:hypothetical protein
VQAHETAERVTQRLLPPSPVVSEHVIERKAKSTDVCSYIEREFPFLFERVACFVIVIGRS